MSHPVPSTPHPAAVHEEPLTARERQVIQFICRGYTNRELVEELSISMNTVKTIVRSVYLKINVGSRSQAVLWGARNGLVDELGHRAVPHP